MDELKKQAEANFNGFKKIVEFIKTLDDDGIEIFILIAKEQGHNIGSENALREVLKEIRDGKKI